MENLIVRKATKEDVADILGFIKGIAVYEHLESQFIATEEKITKSIFEKHQAHVILAIYDGKTVGMALYFYNYSTFLGQANIYLEDLFVEKNYRNLGIGKKLLKALAKEAMDNNCKRLDWSCLDWNEPSLEFYRKIGAIAMPEWVLHRLEEQQIKKIALEEF